MTRYSGPLREGAREADRFSDKNSKAALAARKMGLAAKEAGDKAAKAMSLAGEAAEKLAMGEIKAEEAAQAEAKALREMERAAIKAAEAERATARAADEAAKQYRQAARDAELAAAAERLGALKASGAVKEHNAAVKDLERRFGDLSKEGSGAFKAIETDFKAASTQLEGRGPLIAIGIANGLALLPEAASAAGEGIVLGLGGALTAIGLKAQAGSADVRRTFSKLKTDISGDLKDISAPFHATWLRIAADADHAFHELEPSLKGAFSEMAPAVSHFESTVISGLSGPRVQAAIESLGHSFGPILDELGPATASAIGDVADGIKSISDAAAQNPGALAGLVTGIGQITKVTAEGIGALIKYKTGIETLVMVGTGGGPLGLYKLVNSIHAGTQAILGSNSGFQTATRTFPSFSQQATAAAAASGHLMTANQAAALSANQLKTAMDNLTGKTLTEREALIQYRSAITQMNQALKDNGHAHGFATQKGAQNEQALDGMAVAAQKAAQAMRDDGKGAREVSQFLEGARQRIIAAAEKMHYSAAAAKALADKLLGVRDATNKIPTSHKTKITADTGWAMSNLDRFLATVNRIPTHRQLSIDVRYNGIRPDLAATGGKYMGPGKGFKYAAGGEVSGLITGPGTGTSDSIPAPWLSNGEFVTNEKVTAENTAALMNLNRGMSWAQAGALAGEGYAKGGKVKPATKAQKAAAEHRVTLARSRPEYLAALAAQHALEAMRKSVYGGFFGGGPSTVGSAHGTVVQHTNVINVTVQGNVWQTTQLAQELQSVILRNGMSLTLPKGR
jgi:hypothetical protein